MEFNLNYLAQLINSIVMDYEYKITEDIELNKAAQKEEVIFNWLNGLCVEELKEVISFLTANGRKVYKRYFKLY
jgi:hypothetical protein